LNNLGGLEPSAAAVRVDLSAAQLTEDVLMASHFNHSPLSDDINRPENRTTQLSVMQDEESAL